MRAFSRLAVVLAAIGTIEWASSVSAVVTVAADAQSSPVVQPSFTPTYTPSNADLLHLLVPSASSGNFALESSTGLSALTDGLYPTLNTGVVGSHPGLATGGNNGGTSVTYNLAAASTINQLVVFGGWNDNGRDQQLFNVEFNSGLGFVSLPLSGANTSGGNVNFNPAVGASLQSATRITISDDGGAPLATGVTQIRFNFPSTPAVENGYTGYAELDAIGVVPEPASIALLTFASAGLLLRRRRS
jgi:hypothetical protein